MKFSTTTVLLWKLKKVRGSLTNGGGLIVIFTLTYYWCQRELLLATGPIFFGSRQQGRVNDIDGRERTISTTPPNSPSPWQCLMVFEAKSFCSKLLLKGLDWSRFGWICANLRLGKNAKCTYMLMYIYVNVDLESGELQVLNVSLRVTNMRKVGHLSILTAGF